MESITITYDGRPAACAGAHRFWLAVDVEALPTATRASGSSSSWRSSRATSCSASCPARTPDERALAFAYAALGGADD